MVRKKRLGTELFFIAFALTFMASFFVLDTGYTSASIEDYIILNKATEEDLVFNGGKESFDFKLTDQDFSDTDEHIEDYKPDPPDLEPFSDEILHDEISQLNPSIYLNLFPTYFFNSLNILNPYLTTPLLKIIWGGPYG